MWFTSCYQLIKHTTKMLRVKEFEESWKNILVVSTQLLKIVCYVAELFCISGKSIPKNCVDTSEIDWIRMGTTVATNALLERKGVRVLLITTVVCNQFISATCFFLSLSLGIPRCAIHRKPISSKDFRSRDGSSRSALRARRRSTRTSSRCWPMGTR